LPPWLARRWVIVQPLRQDFGKRQVLVPVREAAEMLGVTVATIRRQIRDHMLPIRRIGHSVRVDMSALRPLTDEEVEREAYRA